MTPHTRPLLTLTLAGLLSAALIAPAEARSGPSQRTAPPPTRVDLPDNFQPEGIATRGPVAYLGSRRTGAVYATDLRTGRGSVISRGDGTPAVGLELSGSQLWAAGGGDGDVKVVDVRTGRVTARHRLVRDPVPGQTFINDVVVTGRTAWVTDSLQAALFRVRGGVVTRVPLTGDWTQTPGVNNANGIETTPDGRALLVVNSSNGLLYRVDPATGRTTQVDLGGTLLTNGDGLTREGRTLFAVQNRLNQVAQVRLAPGGRSGRLVRTLTSPEFDVPTTVARSGGALYLPNARFTTPPTPTTEYWVTRLED